MPFDTIGRSQKRSRFSGVPFNEPQDIYFSEFDDISPFTINHSHPKDWSPETWISDKHKEIINKPELPSIKTDFTESTTTGIKPDKHSVHSLLSLPTCGNTTFWEQPTLSMPSTAELDIWSKFNLSYTDVGINMEANVTSASDLHSLIDVFSKLCSTDSPMVAHDHCSHSPPLFPLSPITNASNDEYPISSNQSVTSTSSGITLCRNKSHKLKPVNYFASVGRLGQIVHPHSKHGLISLKQVADACIDTYFTCWIRYTPVLNKDEFMIWYHAQPDATNTLIVNAMCLFVFRHMVLHHSIPGVEHFVGDQDKILEQEEYFFDAARECLSQSFDNPDRFTIVSLLLMVFRAEPSRKHHYAGMAVSALHELEIYPRTVAESDDESYEKEMDTRLWWFVWAWDFYLYSSGSPKNTPQPRIPGSEIDYPKVLEQDIDESEISIIAYIHCLRLWKIQAHLIATIYEQESDMTVEQLQEYDQQLLGFYAELPDYLKFDSGFEYGHEDLFLACIRVNIEYNATRIILHKLFIPDQNDPRPSQFSLESLNICLKTALNQLPTLNSGSFLPTGRCSFDRDEFWRASEVISMAMDIYRACASIEDRALIIRDICPVEFENGLTRALDILRNTMEFEALNRNWIQVADWLQVEIRRHQLYSSPRSKLANAKNNKPNNKKSDYYLANLKADAEKKRQDGMADTYKIKCDLSRRMSLSSATQDSTNDSQSTWMQHQQITSHPTTVVPDAYPISPSPISFIDQSHRFQNNTNIQFNNSKFLAIPPSSSMPSFVPYQPTTQPSLNPSPETKTFKNQPKFRYFSPRKMNKYMFIDDNPMS
ncbi:hypothetical protein EDC94DRAFT_699883 [Helicostylum pulchrum]|nr:hypothetical protein EDC94DRAFT_699883 [Helicostylum pulchrum]